MKKIVSSVLLASVLFTALPAKRAEAGVLIHVAAGKGECAGLNRCSSVWHARAAIVGTAGVFGGVLIGAAVGSPVLIILGGSLLILDTDASLPQDQLANALAQKYPFINNDEVVSDLASAIKEEAIAQEPVDDKIEVKLSPEAIRSILAPTDLMETHPDEVEAMIQELM